MVPLSTSAGTPPLSVTLMALTVSISSSNCCLPTQLSVSLLTIPFSSAPLSLPAACPRPPMSRSAVSLGVIFGCVGPLDDVVICVNAHAAHAASADSSW